MRLKWDEANITKHEYTVFIGGKIDSTTTVHRNKVL